MVRRRRQPSEGDQEEGVEGVRIAFQKHCQNDKMGPWGPMDIAKGLDAQYYTLCSLAAAEAENIEEIIIGMDASRSRWKTDKARFVVISNASMPDRPKFKNKKGVSHGDYNWSTR